MILIPTADQHKTIHQSNQKKSGLKRKRIHDLLLVENYGLSKGTSKNDILESSASRRSSSELPLIDFTTIKKATNNFSETNKLGSGGFGTVYEVNFRSQHIYIKQVSQIPHKIGSYK